MEKQKVIMSWSGGKDSALALHEIKKTGGYEIKTLLTTITESYDRISMHGVRKVLLERQARSLGFQLENILISTNATNEEYESKMHDVLTKYKSAQVSSVVFGDIFLEDLRKYREEKLAGIDMTAIFPIWKNDTSKLAKDFIKSGFKAITTCVDSKVLGKKFVGRTYDEQFLSDLPPNIDPCGENGEFHTFVYDGPLFKNPINHLKGEIVLRDNRFYFCDLK